MKDGVEQFSLCIAGWWWWWWWGVVLYSINMAKAPDRWETCPDAEARLLHHKSPCNWCHNGCCDEKLVVSKKKKKKAHNFMKLVQKSRLEFWTLMFLSHILNYEICSYHFFLQQEFMSAKKPCNPIPSSSDHITI